jgi:circadian clock protein KaiC
MAKTTKTAKQPADISEAKSSKLTRVPTGIREFDKMVGGGFVRRSNNLIAGSAGSGKTIFAIEYLVRGITEYNEVGMYLTFEERKESLYEDMMEFGWDLAKLESEGKFIFLHYKPEQMMKIITEGGGVIESIMQDSKVKRLVIDSITSFALLYKDTLAKKEAALGLFELISKWGVTCLMTSEEESAYEKTMAATLEFEVDSIILMYHIKVEGKRERAIEILKMRGTNHSQDTVLLDITKQGIKIDQSRIIRI